MLLDSSFAQVAFLGVGHFASVGMWNALNGIGSLGTDDPGLSHYCNAVMYLAGIAGGVLGGVAVNIVGIKRAALLGLWAQASTLLAYWIYYFYWRSPLALLLVAVYNGCASLGISCFTSAIGAALCYYPLPAERNKFIATASALLNLGGLFGGVLAVAMNFTRTETPALSCASYLFIVAVSFCGVAVGLFGLRPHHRVRKSDGTAPVMQQRDVLAELKELHLGFSNKYLYLLMPLFLVNVWHEVVLFNYFNAGLFNIRSRAVNSCCYYVARLGAGFLFHAVCENAGRALKQRVNAVVMLINTLLALGALCSLHIFYTLGENALLDFTERRSLVAVCTFLIYGSLETISSNFTYWLLAELPIGDPQMRNRIIGLSRSFINLGGCLSWTLDIFALSPFVQWSLNLLVWFCSVGGCLIAASLDDHSSAADQKEFDPDAPALELPPSKSRTGQLLTSQRNTTDSLVNV